MARVDLANGQWAELRDPKSFRQRDRKALLLALDQIEGGNIAKGIAMQDRLLVLLVESWSFPMPAPALDPASLDELEVGDYDLLMAECEAVRQIMFPDFSVDPDSVPTVPSAP